jgi:DNA end-binding protein Ku
MWKGSIGFGMVQIPVKLYKSVEAKDIRFHTLHTVCGSRIQMPKWCPKCEKHLPPEELVKGYPLDEKAGSYVQVNGQDFEMLPLSSIKSIQVDGFVPSIDDPRWFDSTYVLSPEEVGVHAFVLFAKAMKEMNLLGIGKIAIRDRESLCAVRPDETGLLFLQTLFWGDELRDYSDLHVGADVSEKEMEMAKMLIKAMVKPIQLDAYKDNYRDALVELISAKLEGRKLEPLPEAKKPEGDLVEQLMASLKAVEAEPAKVW